MIQKRRKSKVRSPLLDDAEVGEARTLSEQAYRIIRAAILECRIPPSAIIDERALMKEHGLGRTPVREALLRLSGERLVIFQAGQVIQVAPIGPTDIRDLYELRLHSERLAVRLMMERRTPQLVEKLSHCFDAAPALLERGQIEETIALDFRFHALLYEGSGNVFVANMLRNLFGHSYRLWLLPTLAMSRRCGRSCVRTSRSWTRSAPATRSVSMSKSLNISPMPTTAWSAFCVER